MRHHHHGHHHDVHEHGHDHDHAHDVHDHHHHDHVHPPHGPGHNHPHAQRAPVQWQTPHQPDGATNAVSPEADLDKVEAAFVDGFISKLLRVEIDALTDVGSLTPHLGGATFRYDPLPSNFISRRRRLRFVYFDGANLRPLSYAELRDIDRG